MRSTLWLLAGLTLLLPSLVWADEEDAVRVYKQLRPSVVSLQNIEGSGTGIIINASGLILTNAHVVASPLPFKVKVDTGKEAELTFKHVQIVGYHPRLDLALVKIDPQEQHATLLPVTISKTKADPGQRIFAIGNPALGTILTRTITSGMISGVDRMVDGEKYYQTDAAINPGNSGGPIVDRTGKVLGVVTFKFNDVQATGFAIPLHDVDLKGFQPITVRKSDPAKAVELSKLAEKYSAEADRVGRAQGMDSEDRKLLNAYAAMCYRLALVHDPTNTGIYYNIGMLLQRIGENEVAVGYLTRALELEPWDKNNGNPYRELGLSLAAEKREADAFIVWREGLAKSPYAAKIWEDVAITYANQQKFLEAGVAAATALLLESRDVRKSVLNKIADDAAKQVHGAEQQALDERTTPKAIIAVLDKLLIDSNAARKQRKIWITLEFVQLMKTMGGEPIPGVEKTISAEPTPRAEVLAQYTGDVTQKAASGKPTAPKSGRIASTPAPGKAGATASSTTPGSTTPGKAGGSMPADPGDWAGSGAVTGKVPVAVATAKKLDGAHRHVGDATVIAITAKGAVDVVFSADGAFAFILQKDGVLRKMAIDTFTEEKQLDIASPCTALARAKNGLVVTVSGTQEVWLLNEDLVLQKRVALPGVKYLVASPQLPYAYASSGGFSLFIIDLVKGTVHEKTGKEFQEEQGIQRPVRVGFWHIAIAPAGNYLFAEGANTGLMRMKIKGDDVIFDAGSPVEAGNPRRVDVSGDSRYVAVLAGGGNYIKGMPHSNYATYVFSVQNLDKPVTVIESGPYPQTLGFDAVARSIYAQNHEKSLIVFSGAGLKGKEYDTGESGSDVQKFLVHPAGKKLFVVLERQLYWVQLP